MRWPVGGALFALVLTADLLAAQTRPSAAAPSPRSPVVVGGERVLLWAPAPTGGSDRLEVRRGSDSVAATTVDSGRFLHHTVRLARGANRVVLARGDSALTTWDLWYAAPSPAAPRPPAGVPRFRLHGDTAATCGSCHRGQWSPDAGVAVPLDSLACFSCHRELESAAVRHGPAAGWQCLVCHEPAGAGILREMSQRNGPRCLSCHTALAAAMAVAPVGHGPAAGGFCTTCHDPHGSSQPRLLRESVNAVCGACHPDHLDGRHVTGWSGSSRPHPVANVADPSTPGRQITCISCHDPHAAGYRFLFRNAASLEALCQSCHSGPRAR